MNLATATTFTDCLLPRAAQLPDVRGPQRGGGDQQQSSGLAAPPAKLRRDPRRRSAGAHEKPVLGSGGFGYRCWPGDARGRSVNRVLVVLGATPTRPEPLGKGGAGPSVAGRSQGSTVACGRGPPSPSPDHRRIERTAARWARGGNPSVRE